MRRWRIVGGRDVGLIDHGWRHGNRRLFHYGHFHYWRHNHDWRDDDRWNDNRWDCNWRNNDGRHHRRHNDWRYDRLNNRRIDRVDQRLRHGCDLGSYRNGCGRQVDLLPGFFRSQRR